MPVDYSHGDCGGRGGDVERRSGLGGCEEGSHFGGLMRYFSGCSSNIRHVLKSIVTDSIS